jgi:hypothetical protein
MQQIGIEQMTRRQHRPCTCAAALVKVDYPRLGRITRLHPIVIEQSFTDGRRADSFALQRKKSELVDRVDGSQIA